MSLESIDRRSVSVWPVGRNNAATRLSLLLVVSVCWFGGGVGWFRNVFVNLLGVRCIDLEINLTTHVLIRNEFRIFESGERSHDFVVPMAAAGAKRHKKLKLKL